MTHACSTKQAQDLDVHDRYMADGCVFLQDHLMSQKRRKVSASHNAAYLGCDQNIVSLAAYQLDKHKAVQNCP
jgi:hypothetical protein